MKRFTFNKATFKADAVGYASELGWMVLYTIALFLLTWIISVIPW